MTADKQPEAASLVLAERHADAISDTGYGYAVERQARGWWRIDCLWCDWYAQGSTKRRAVERYREHEAAALAPLRGEAVTEQSARTACSRS